MKKLLILFILSFSLIEANNLKNIPVPIEIKKEQEIDINKLEERTEALRQKVVKELEKLDKNIEDSTKKMLNTKENMKKNISSENILKKIKIIQYILNPLLIIVVLLIYYKKRKEYTKIRKNIKIKKEYEKK